MDCEIVVVGAPQHATRLDDLLRAALHSTHQIHQGNPASVVVLFPWDGDSSVANIFGQNSSLLLHSRETVAGNADGDLRKKFPVTVIVPDGSWACATSLVHELLRRASTLLEAHHAAPSLLTFCRLSSDSVADH